MWHVNISPTKLNRVNTSLTVDYGGKYWISVSTSADGAATTRPIKCEGPPIPVPSGLMANILSNGNGLVYWEFAATEDLKKIG